MKLIRKNLEKDKSGSVTLYAQENEDLWHIYNILRKGDRLTATTIRKVVSETATGSTDKSSVRLTLTILVDKVEYDVEGSMLRVNGRNLTENKFIKLGQYHTIEVELHRNFTISKLEWDTIAFDRIEEACDVGKQAEIAAIVLQEGLANICLLTDSMTVTRQRIEVAIPRKRRGSTSNHEKAMERFYDQVVQGILRHVDFGTVRVILVASPGFVKDELFQYMMDWAIKTDNRTLIENKRKFMLIHSSSGHKHALQEVLSDPSVQVKLQDTKYSREVKALERFYKMLNDDQNRAFYSYKHVAAAAEVGAIDTLMVTDELFRSASIPTRRKYIGLVDGVKAQGGTVLVFSSLHVTGEQLTQLSGVAAILKFPIEEPEGDAQEAEPEVVTDDEEPDLDGLQDDLPPEEFEEDMEAFQ